MTLEGRSADKSRKEFEAEGAVCAKAQSMKPQAAGCAGKLPVEGETG